MKKIVTGLMITLILGGVVFAVDLEAHQEPVREHILLNMNAGNRIGNNDLQKMFTAMAISYLKSNSSYILAYEIYRDRARQNALPSIVLSELDYGSFTIINIRYSFSNGYFEFKLSQSPFTNIVNDEVVPSVDYNGITGASLYKPINDKLQEAVYISRGYAAMYRRPSSSSFYLFK